MVVVAVVGFVARFVVAVLCLCCYVMLAACPGKAILIDLGVLLMMSMPRENREI